MWIQLMPFFLYFLVLSIYTDCFGIWVSICLQFSINKIILEILWRFVDGLCFIFMYWFAMDPCSLILKSWWYSNPNHVSITSFHFWFLLCFFIFLIAVQWSWLNFHGLLVGLLILDWKPKSAILAPSFIFSCKSSSCGWACIRFLYFWLS